MSSLFSVAAGVGKRRDGGFDRGDFDSRRRHPDHQNATSPLRVRRDPRVDEGIESKCVTGGPCRTEAACGRGVSELESCDDVERERPAIAVVVYLLGSPSPVDRRFPTNRPAIAIRARRPCRIFSVSTYSTPPWPASVNARLLTWPRPEPGAQPGQAGWNMRIFE